MAVTERLKKQMTTQLNLKHSDDFVLSHLMSILWHALVNFSLQSSCGAKALKLTSGPPLHLQSSAFTPHSGSLG